MEMPNDLATCMETIPPALDELAKSQGTVQQIALYCKAAYQEGSDVNAVFEQTKNYTNDALQNVVYHVHNVGLQVPTHSLLFPPPPRHLSRTN
jgi:hypothetical protein